MQYVRALLESRPYLSRVPDQSIVVEPLDGADHISRHPRRRLLVRLQRAGPKIHRQRWKDTGRAPEGLVVQPPVRIGRVDRRIRQSRSAASSRLRRRDSAAIGCWCWTMLPERSRNRERLFTRPRTPRVRNHRENRIIVECRHGCAAVLVDIHFVSDHHVRCRKHRDKLPARSHRTVRTL